MFKRRPQMIRIHPLKKMRRKEVKEVPNLVANGRFHYLVAFGRFHCLVAFGRFLMNLHKMCRRKDLKGNKGKGFGIGGLLPRRWSAPPLHF